MGSKQRIVFDSYDDLKKGNLLKSQMHFLKLLETHDVEIKSTGTLHKRKCDSTEQEYLGWIEFLYGVYEPDSP